MSKRGNLSFSVVDDLQEDLFMNRKEITKLLTNTLISTKLNDRKYYAKEVTLDYGTTNPKRVDVMQYIPSGVTYAGDIERGEFVCYEIKSCKEDVYSGHGLRFYGDKNYIVTTMDCYKDILKDGHKFVNYLKENYPDSDTSFGIMVLVPGHIDLSDSSALHGEFENPTLLDKCDDWKLWAAQNCYKGKRKRGTTELLFCMLRAKHSYTNFVEE